MTGDEAVAQYRQQHAQMRAAFSNQNNCMHSIGGLRYSIMAEMMEKKMQTLQLSDKERSQWQADITAVRASADSGGTTMPKVDDPVNPYRSLTRLSSPDEQMALNNEYVKQSQALMAQCKPQSRYSREDRAR
jgi:hypothetical protein